MPYADHEVFRPPENPEVPIWRYMDFTKFVSMLVKQFGEVPPLNSAIPNRYLQHGW